MAQVLQEDLIIEILLQLPVKSLMRFKCLSKSLCAVIETPYFINSHNLICSSEKLNKHKLIFKDYSKYEFKVCDVNVDSEEEILCLGKPVSSSLNCVSGYCKGLLLLRTPPSGFKFTLWNPSTHQFRNLPDFPYTHADLPNKTLIGLGLGYDDSIDDYKVFCIVHVRDVKPTLEFQFWIFGLKSNIWRRGLLDYPYKDDRFPGIGCFIDGSLHWLIEYERKLEIVAFDMRKETFSIIPRPDCLYGVTMKLHVLEDCLCISFFSIIRDEDDCFYVRKKDWVDKFTWTKLFSVTKNGTNALGYGTILPWNINLYDYQKVKAMGYSKRKDKILLHLSGDGIIWYNLEKKKALGRFKWTQIFINGIVRFYVLKVLCRYKSIIFLE